MEMIYDKTEFQRLEWKWYKMFLKTSANRLNNF